MKAHSCAIVLAVVCVSSYCAAASSWQLLASTCAEPLAAASYLRITGAVAEGMRVRTPDIPAPKTAQLHISEPLRVAFVSDPSGKIECFELWGRPDGGAFDREAIFSELSSGLKEWEFRPYQLGPKIVPVSSWFFLEPKGDKLVVTPPPARIRGFSPER